MTWVPGAAGSPYDVDNLPLGVFTAGDEPPRVGARIGEHVVDLAPVAAADMLEISHVFEAPSLNPLLEEWPNGEIALAFGSAGLYRRSAGAGSNARVEARPHDTTLAIIATRDIDQGAEIIVELRPPSKALQRRRLWSSSFVAGAWRLGRNIRGRAQTKEAR